MKRLLIITQKVDERDDLLGFFVAWIREFSAVAERVTVLTLAKGVYRLPDSVHVISLGKEGGAGTMRMTVRLLRELWRQTSRHNVVFAHMSPIFAILAAPFTLFSGTRLALWYLHRSVTWKLKIALQCVDTLFTADTQSLMIKSRKIVAVGHGIERERFLFPLRVAPRNRPVHILSVGRLSPIKRFETLLEALSMLRDTDADYRVRIVGAPVMSRDEDYAEYLRDRVDTLGLRELVTFVGFVPYNEMPQHYHWADIVVGCTPTGGIDKTLLEGMTAGCVVITSNQVMKKYLGAHASDLVYAHGDARDLQRAIESVRDFDVLSHEMVVGSTEFSSDVVVQRIVRCL